MTADQRVIVVGGGIVGVSCAYSLAKRGARVTLLERDVLDDGVSIGNAGIIAPGHLPLPMPGLIRQMLRVFLSRSNPLYITPRPTLELLAWLWRFWRCCNSRQLAHTMEALADLGRLSDECFQNLHANEGIDGEYQRSGRLECFRTERGRAHALHTIGLTKQYGFEAEQLSAEDVRRREPVFRDDVLGAAWFPESGFANPAMFLTELADRARRNGVEIVENAKAIDIRLRGQTVRGVSMADGRFLEGGAVVLAAGVWTPRLAQLLGVRIPMQAGKGYHVDLTGIDPLPTTTCTLMETYIAATPIAGGLRLAGTVELSGINDRMMQRRLEMLTIGAKRYLRGIDEAHVTSTWCGLRPMTADGLPVIGPVPGVPGVVIATGHSMMGFMLGPGTGQVVSELILDGESSIDISSMSPERF